MAVSNVNNNSAFNVKFNQETGKIEAGGASSGMNIPEIMKGLEEAAKKNLNVIEDKITLKTNQLSAIATLGAKISSLENISKALEGTVSLGDSQNIFASKVINTSTTSTNPSPSSADQLVKITANNNANIQNFSLEVLQTAKNNIIKSGTGFASSTSALNLSGTFDISYKDSTGASQTATITIANADTLLTIAQKITDSDSNLEANVINLGASSNQLIISNKNTNEAIKIKDTTANSATALMNSLGFGTLLDDLGNYVFDPTIVTGSGFDTNPANLSGNINIEYKDVYGVTQSSTVSIVAGDTLSNIAQKINNAGSNLSAIVVSVGGGNYKMIIKNMDVNQAIKIKDTTGGSGTALMTGLGLNNGLDGDGYYSFTPTNSSVTSQSFAPSMIKTFGNVISRNNNIIEDVIPGVRMVLIKGEIGTTINAEVDTDVNKIKGAIVDFVESYNDLRTFINEQKKVNAQGELSAEAYLAKEATFKNLDLAINRYITNLATGISGNYQGLSSIGLTLHTDVLNGKNAYDEATQLRQGLMVIDEQLLDQALENNVNNIRDMMSFKHKISDSRLTLNAWGKMPLIDPDNPQTANLRKWPKLPQYNSTGVKLDVVVDNLSGKVTGATVKWTDQDNVSHTSAATISSDRVILIEEGPAAGMEFFYSDTVNGATDIQIDYTIGVIPALSAGLLDSYNTVDGILDNIRKAFETDISKLQHQDKSAEQAKLDKKMEMYQQKFAKLEAALARMNHIQEMISQMMASWFQSK